MAQMTIEEIELLNGKRFYVYLASDNIPVQVSKGNLIKALKEFHPQMAKGCKYLVEVEETPIGYFISN